MSYRGDSHKSIKCLKKKKKKTLTCSYNTLRRVHFRVNSYYIAGNSRCRDQRGVDRFKSLSGKTANQFSVFNRNKKSQSCLKKAI